MITRTMISSSGPILGILRYSRNIAGYNEQWRSRYDRLHLYPYSTKVYAREDRLFLNRPGELSDVSPDCHEATQHLYV